MNDRKSKELIEISMAQLTSMLFLYVCKHTIKNILKLLLIIRTLTCLALSKQKFWTLVNNKVHFSVLMRAV